MNPQYKTYLENGRTAGLRYGIHIPRNTHTGLLGSRLGSRYGSSLEFMDHREYIPGDDLRRIDWSAFARSDKLSIKLYRDEVSPHVDIIIDTSKSMALQNSQKTNATLAMAALFAQASANRDYSFTSWTCGKDCKRIENGSRLPAEWQDIQFDHTGNCAQTLSAAAPPFANKGIRILISDLLWLGDPLAFISLLANRASAVFIVQILASADAEPPARGNIRLADSETEQTKDIYIDMAAQERYRANLAEHQQNFSRAARQSGAVMTTLIAEKLLENFNLDELVLSEVLEVL